MRILSIFRSNLLRVGACLIAGAICSTTLIAKPGDLDRSFGTAGIAVSEGAVGYVLAPQSSQDRIIYAGYCRMSVGSSSVQPCATAYTQNGVKDYTFGGDGAVVIPVTGHFTAVTRLSDQQIAFAGNCYQGLVNSAFCIVVTDNSGNRTQTFGMNGFVISKFSDPYGNDVPSAIVPVSGARFLVVGKCEFSGPPRNWDFCAARYHSNGTLDSSFGAEGKVRFPISAGSGFDYADAVVEAENGSMVIVGTCATDSAGYGEICVSKITDSGVVDTTFATNGFLRLRGPDVRTGTIARTALRSPNGNIVIGGTCNGSYEYVVSDSRFCATTISALGAVDPSFGIGGWFMYSAPSGWFNALSGTRQKDGQVLLVGQCITNGSTLYDFCAVRVGVAGNLDGTFGNNGLVTVPFPDATYEGAGSVFLDSRQRAFLGGGCSYSGVYKACFTRLHTRQDYFDLDNDNESNPANDGVLYLRHLLGYRDTALTAGAMGTYADRTVGADIANYLATPNATYPNCSASIVSAPGGPSAMLDGVVLLRAMFGLTGTAVTNGINFPAGTVRTT